MYHRWGKERVRIKRTIHQSPWGAGQIKAHKRASLLGAALLSQPPSSFHINSLLCFSFFWSLTPSPSLTRIQQTPSPQPPSGGNYTHKAPRNPVLLLMSSYDNVHRHSLIHATPLLSTCTHISFAYCILIDCYSRWWNPFMDVSGLILSTSWSFWLTEAYILAFSVIFYWVLGEGDSWEVFYAPKKTNLIGLTVTFCTFCKKATSQHGHKIMLLLPNLKKHFCLFLNELKLMGLNSDFYNFFTSRGWRFHPDL